MRRALRNLCGVMSVVGLGCSSGADEPAPASSQAPEAGLGGAGSGGSLATGGAKGTGGSSATGGAKGTGGSPATGGSTGSGGSTATGGTTGSGGATGSGGSTGDGGIPPVSGCPSSQTLGTWQNVTPPTLDPLGGWGGCQTLLQDPALPSTVYLNCDFQGTWKSTDCGATWTKKSTGVNGDKVNGGRQWCAAIDRNPQRDPKTPPVLYVALGYGTGGFWKSTNDGVDWTNVWDNNIYAPDGTTNISSDLGGDVACGQMPDPADPNHLVLFLHSYWGTGGNNGIFETTDAGGKWILHKAQTFSFQPHSDGLFTYDKSTWMVTHSPSWMVGELYRTTDSAATWNLATGEIGVQMHSPLMIGTTMYAAAYGIYKTTDKGASWARSDAGVYSVYTLFRSPTNMYLIGGQNDNDVNWKIRRAPLTDVTTWTDVPIPSSLPWGEGGAQRASASWGVAIFDGTHEVLVTSNWNAGVWRYVMP
jgi:hypothetical protein